MDYSLCAIRDIIGIRNIYADNISINREMEENMVLWMDKDKNKWCYDSWEQLFNDVGHYAEFPHAFQIDSIWYRSDYPFCKESEYRQLFGKFRKH